MTPERAGDPAFEYRLAEIVYLDEKGAAPAGCDVSLGQIKAAERLGFEHEFDPAGRMPEPAF